MQINWFTVIAQIINFLILVWLLKRFLYKPILKAIDEREEKIAAQIKDAEAKDVTAKKEQAEFQKKNETFDKEKKEFIDTLKSDSKPILVQSAFDLPEKQQADIKNAVNDILGMNTKYQFKTTPELISGIEISSNGYKIAWSISAYLDSIQKNISETMKEEQEPGPKEEPKAESKAESKPKLAAKDDSNAESKVKEVSKAEPAKKPEPVKKAELKGK